MKREWRWWLVTNGYPVSTWFFILNSLTNNLFSAKHSLLYNENAVKILTFNKRVIRFLDSSELSGKRASKVPLSKMVENEPDENWVCRASIWRYFSPGLTLPYFCCILFITTPLTSIFVISLQNKVKYIRTNQNCERFENMLPNTFYLFFWNTNL